MPTFEEWFEERDKQNHYPRMLAQDAWRAGWDACAANCTPAEHKFVPKEPDEPHIRALRKAWRSPPDEYDECLWAGFYDDLP